MTGRYLHWTGAIRAAAEEDLPEIVRLVASGWRRAYRDILPLDVLEIHCDLRRRETEIQNAWKRGDRILLATSEDGHVLGTVGDHNPARLSGFDTEVDRLYVRPDVTRGGIGRALMTALAGEFLQRGCRSMAVHTFQDNVAGRGFYERLGGKFHSADIWEGYACVWYTWDEAAMSQIVPGKAQAPTPSPDNSAPGLP